MRVGTHGLIFCSFANSRPPQWATWTSVLGEEMAGVWPAGSDVTDVNASCRTLDKQVVVTADDFGMVKLFDFPTMEHAKFKKYAGHSSHVTCVRFACNDQYLVSTGGMDTSVIVWRYGESMRACVWVCALYPAINFTGTFVPLCLCLSTSAVCSPGGQRLLTSEGGRRATLSSLAAEEDSDESETDSDEDG